MGTRNLSKKCPDLPETSKRAFGQCLLGVVLDDDFRCALDPELHQLTS